MMADLAETQKDLAKREKRSRFLRPAFIVSTALFLLTLLVIYIPGETMAEIFRVITFGGIDVAGGTVPTSSTEFYVAVVISWALFMWRYIIGGRKRSTCNIASVVFLLFMDSATTSERFSSCFSASSSKMFAEYISVLIPRDRESTNDTTPLTIGHFRNGCFAAALT